MIMTSLGNHVNGRSSKSKPCQPTMPEFEGAMRRVRQHIMAQPTPDLWPSERIGDPLRVAEPYTLAMRYMGKKTDKIKRRKGENGEISDHTARAANCFILFRMHVHQVAVGLFPAETKTLQDKLSARAGELWKELSKDAKEQFAKEAKEMERFHKVQFPGYKYKPAKNKKQLAAAKKVNATSISVNNNNLTHQQNNNVNSTIIHSEPYGHLTVSIPTSCSSLSDDPYCSPFSHSESPRPASRQELSPFSAWQTVHAPMLLGGSSMLSDMMDSGAASSPCASSLPPSTPCELRTQQQPRPASQPDEYMMQRAQMLLSQRHQLESSSASRHISFLKDEVEDVDMTLQPLDIPDGAPIACPDPLMSEGVYPSPSSHVKSEDVHSGTEALTQLLLDSAAAVDAEVDSVAGTDEISWLAALNCVNQGVGGHCLPVSMCSWSQNPTEVTWDNTPLPADLVDIPLRNWEQVVE